MSKKSIPTPIKLSQIVEDVANELREVKAKEPAEPVIRFSACDIELTVGAVIEGGGKIKFVVFEGGADATYSNTQKVKLSFTAAGTGVAAVALTNEPAPLPKQK